MRVMESPGVLLEVFFIHPAGSPELWKTEEATVLSVHWGS